MTIYSGFSHWKWWFSIVMLVYQRVSGNQTSWEIGQETTGAFRPVGWANCLWGVKYLGLHGFWSTTSYETDQRTVTFFQSADCEFELHPHSRVCWLSFPQLRLAACHELSIWTFQSTIGPWFLEAKNMSICNCRPLSAINRYTWGYDSNFFCYFTA